MKTYEVVGRYPAFRPKEKGSTVTLTEEAARYHVLDGTLKEMPAETAEQPAAADKRKAGSK